MHLIIDAILGRIPSRDEVCAWLEAMPKQIGMTAICPALVVQKNGGIQGIIIIAESHICLDVRDRQMWLDVFSCKPFDVGAARDKIKRMLPIEFSQSRVLSRPLPALEGACQGAACQCKEGGCY